MRMHGRTDRGICQSLLKWGGGGGESGDPFQVGGKAGPEAVRGGKRHKFLKQATLVWDCSWQTDNKLHTNYDT